MMWVVMAHCYFFYLFEGGTVNTTNVMVPASKPFFLLVPGALVSVDVFLALGGFFLAFAMLRYKITAKICALGALQRVFRVWPAFILSMLFEYSILMSVGSGILWSKY